jgi:hypothetical protein
MATPKINVPSPQYILNIIIALAIVSAIARFVPDNVKQYFRI